MAQKPLAIVILAAGKGTRMHSALPKVMHPLAGMPMIGWLLHTVEKLEPEKIIVVASSDAKDLHAFVKPHGIAIQATQDGTGGALRAALPALKDFNGNVLVLLGDTPLLTAATLEKLIAARKDKSTGISVLAVELDDPTGYGRIIADKTGILKKIAEEKDATAKEKSVKLVNTGAFCLDGSKLAGWVEKLGTKNAQGEYYITDLPVIAAKKEIKTKVIVVDDALEAKGCNTRADLAVLEAAVQMRLRAGAMAAGVTLVDPTSVYFSYDTEIGADVIIEPQVFFGPGVEIAGGVHIKAFSHLEGARIASGASIGPYARLRPGTDIGEDVRVGNFVEIKKSKIGKGSKINHLAYVGDCTMGKNVNFSAGAITVNYDGFEKHETIIGKDVMIGSNVNLVAPLTIDDGAFVAAGSTITEDVPADSLSIARDEAQVRKGWAAEYRKRKQALADKLGNKKKE
jgi:bifunctional UDP-N-acetylglucosamine pyrophosphorylase / glucosamine-1-phosphate N-acetyltransferase